VGRRRTGRTDAPDGEEQRDDDRIEPSDNRTLGTRGRSCAFRPRAVTRRDRRSPRSSRALALSAAKPGRWAARPRRAKTRSFGGACTLTGRRRWTPSRRSREHQAGYRDHDRYRVFLQSVPHIEKIDVPVPPATRGSSSAERTRRLSRPRLMVRLRVAAELGDVVLSRFMEAPN
jgi:hypothetical protein